MRRVRTASGAVAVQLVVKDRGEVVDIEHVGSAHTDAELALLLASARERLAPGQQTLELGDLAAEPARLDDIADWTRPEPGFELQATELASSQGGRGRRMRVLGWCGLRR